MNQRRRLVGRRSILLGLGSLTTICAIATSRAAYQDKEIQALDEPKRNFRIAKGLSLKKRAANKGIIYGAATRQIDLSSNSMYAAAIVENCSMLVPEWEFKWIAGNARLRPSAKRFDFTAADWMVDFATTHGQMLRGHTLVWHDSLPQWFKRTVNSRNAASLLENHIQTVMRRYAGKIHSWDVVNEAIRIEDGRSDGWRKTPWLKLLGPNYIDLAFRLAAAADPKALLVYNDFDLDYDTPEQEAKRAAVLKLLEGLLSKGTPIHALGIQAHLSADDKKFNAEKLRQFLRDVASLGLKIMITEMDVIDKNLPAEIKIRDHIVAGIYEDYLSTVLDEQAVNTVITWA